MERCKLHSSRKFSSLRCAVVAGALALFFLAGSSAAPAQTFSVLHEFSGGADGAGPDAGLTPDAAGNFYGTTGSGGSTGCGTVYRLVHGGSGWVFYPIYEFSVADGAFLTAARVIFGPDGSLYGTTQYSGQGNCVAGGLGYGTVFKLQPPPTFCRSVTCYWQLTILYTFAGGSDGAIPWSEVVFDPAGNLYGTTVSGGTGSCQMGAQLGCGTVFKLTRNSNGTWTHSVLYEFQGSPNDGSAPFAGLTLDGAGNLYGTLDAGGSCQGCGAVFELSPSGSGWNEAILHFFDGAAGGGEPYGGLIFDASGNLYGATSYGGAGDYGTVYELTPQQGSWSFNQIYSFAVNQANDPYSRLTFDAAGNLYGSSFFGGTNGGQGTIYELTPSNGSWNYTELHGFDLIGSDGGNPYGAVVVDSSGHVYGTASSGPYPSPDAGVIFEITP